MWQRMKPIATSDGHLILATAAFEQESLIIQALDKLGKVIELQRQFLSDRIQLEKTQEIDEKV